MIYNASRSAKTSFQRPAELITFLKDDQANSTARWQPSTRKRVAAASSYHTNDAQAPADYWDLATAIAAMTA